MPILVRLVLCACDLADPAAGARRLRAVSALSATDASAGPVLGAKSFEPNKPRAQLLVGHVCASLCVRVRVCVRVCMEARAAGGDRSKHCSSTPVTRLRGRCGRRSALAATPPPACAHRNTRPPARRAHNVRPAGCRSVLHCALYCLLHWRTAVPGAAPTTAQSAAVPLPPCRANSYRWHDQMESGCDNLLTSVVRAPIPRCSVIPHHRAPAHTRVYASHCQPPPPTSSTPSRLRVLACAACQLVRACRSAPAATALGRPASGNAGPPRKRAPRAPTHRP